MQCRKLIQFGRSSFVISLPKKWVISNKLKKGDLIFLDDSAQKIVISPTIKKQNKYKQQDISCKKKSITQIHSEIISAYLNNYDCIKLYEFSHDQANDLCAQITSLPGLEIIDQSEQKIMAKDLFHRSEVSLTHIFRRVDMIIRSMLQEAKQGENVEFRDKDVNRLALLSKRVIRSAIEDTSIARSLQLTPLDLIKHYSMIKHLQTVGDQVKRISRHLQDQPESVTQMFTTLKDSYISVMRSFHIKTQNHARRIDLETPERAKKIEKILSSQKVNGQLSFDFKALNSTLKNMARLCLDFSTPPETENIGLIQKLETETGFLKPEAMK